MVKNPPASAGDIRDKGSIPGLGRSPGGGNGNPFQYSCLENLMDRGAWWATVDRVAKSRTWMRRFSTHKDSSTQKPDWTICSSHSPSFWPILSSPPGVPFGTQIHWKVFLVHLIARSPLIFPFSFSSCRSSLSLLNPTTLYFSHNLLPFLSNFVVLYFYIHDLSAHVEYKFLESRGHHWVAFIIPTMCFIHSLQVRKWMPALQFHWSF